MHGISIFTIKLANTLPHMLILKSKDSIVRVSINNIVFEELMSLSYALEKGIEHSYDGCVELEHMLDSKESELNHFVITDFHNFTCDIYCHKIGYEDPIYLYTTKTILIPFLYKKIWKIPIFFQASLLNGGSHKDVEMQNNPMGPSKSIT